MSFYLQFLETFEEIDYDNLQNYEELVLSNNSSDFFPTFFQLFQNIQDYPFEQNENLYYLLLKSYIMRIKGINIESLNQEQLIRFSSDLFHIITSFQPILTNYLNQMEGKNTIMKMMI